MFKSAYVVAATAAFMLVNDASASVTWTIKASGTVARGTNAFGMLGGLGSDLTGMHFTQTITVSSDPSEYLGIDSNADYSLMLGRVTGFTDQITLNDHVFTFPVGGGDGYQELAMGATNHSDANPYDSVITQNGGDLIGNRITAGVSVTRYGPGAGIFAQSGFSTSSLPGT